MSCLRGTLTFLLIAVLTAGCGGRERPEELDVTNLHETGEDVPKVDVLIINVDAQISTDEILSYGSVDTSKSSRKGAVSSRLEPGIEHIEPNVYVEVAYDGSLKVEGREYTLEQFRYEINRLVEEDSTQSKLTGYRFHVSTDPEVKSQRIMDVISLIKRNLRGSSVEVSDSFDQPIPVIMPGIMATSGRAPGISLVVNSQKITVGDLNAVSIYFKRSGEIEFNGEVMAFEELEPLTKRIFDVSQEGHNLAIVRVDGGVEWSKVLMCLSMARNAGAEYLALFWGKPMEMD